MPALHERWPNVSAISICLGDETIESLRPLHKGSFLKVTALSIRMVRDKIYKLLGLYLTYAPQGINSHTHQA